MEHPIRIENIKKLPEDYLLMIRATAEELSYNLKAGEEARSHVELIDKELLARKRSHEFDIAGRTG